MNASAIIAVVMSIVSVIGTISGVALGWKAKSRTDRQETVADASRDAKLQSDIAYIIRGIDDVRLDLREQGRQFDALTERVTRVEESAKQAHHRISGLETRKEIKQ